MAAEESNFRRAALRLDTNQSIISRHGRDIEEELGADLFLREPGHGARLTEVGRSFLRDVREMFDNLDRAKMTALGRRAPNGDHFDRADIPICSPQYPN